MGFRLETTWFMMINYVYHKLTTYVKGKLLFERVALITERNQETKIIVTLPL